MQAEKPYFSPIEKEFHFNDWIKERNVKQFLFDLDNTICNTSKVFDDSFSRIADFLANHHPIISRDQWHQEIHTANHELLHSIGVNPICMEYAADSIIDKYEISPEIQPEIKQMFQQIYHTPVEMLEGSETGLDFLTKLNISIGVVTHANRHWTWNKYNWLNLKRYMNFDDIFIVDENGHKNSESWQQALNYFRVKPQDCVVIGDSLQYDIEPATEIGVRHCFLVGSSIKNLSEITEFGTKNL